MRERGDWRAVKKELDVWVERVSCGGVGGLGVVGAYLEEEREGEAFLEGVV